VTLPDLAATEALAARLAPLAQAGDAVLLEGPLGAGKSAFARAFWPDAKAAGIDLAGTAAALQKQGAEAFEKSWADMLADIRSKSGALASG